MLKKFLVLSVLVLLVFVNYPVNNVNASGAVLGDLEIYKIYDEEFNLLFEKDRVEVGDNYLSKDYKYYEIVYLNEDNHTGVAKFIKYMKKPQVDK